MGDLGSVAKCDDIKCSQSHGLFIDMRLCIAQLWQLCLTIVAERQ